ncbi:GNAT family N-acetyltransferase [Candidatus Woesearchaeota archaeon]|jgi:hypothetical protein|nr:GNAT family N-acetyltransferase [Candidatus Woesearchaeota archaeon]MBT4368135.1 GNAT family N-acetyltransferase [Candidatus Woesearchaeota archaeon]MBT4712623.1 GNAT family N-acetyltransferase [Candidatus Woesearchaeota archaeon]MBT6639536.1 GNAT family N-acetyltransferase [Candidatus Woesearchaeota archaeon]MBT7133708.1 GNAT family N-acetyltransferase [Candidatus Woesearchaeota archaeon]
MVPRFNITRTEREIYVPFVGKRTTLCYNTTFSDPTRPTGDAQVIIGPVSDRQQPNSYQQLIAAGLSHDDLLANINLFFPNGRATHKNPHLRQCGVGSATLKRLTEDALEIGCKALYWIVEQGNPHALAFLAKQNFTAITPQYHFRLLEQD